MSSWVDRLLYCSSLAGLKEPSGCNDCRGGCFIDHSQTVCQSYTPSFTDFVASYKRSVRSFDLMRHTSKLVVAWITIPQGGVSHETERVGAKPLPCARSRPATVAQPLGRLPSPGRACGAPGTARRSMAPRSTPPRGVTGAARRQRRARGKTPPPGVGALARERRALLWALATPVPGPASRRRRAGPGLERPHAWPGQGRTSMGSEAAPGWCHPRRRAEGQIRGPRPR
jgi:hypothetical protein